MEGSLIAVDRWAAGSQAYFLTHLHSDHTVGLSSSWARGPLFCSRLTAKLFPFKFPDFRLSSLRLLDLGSWHSIPLISPSSGSGTVVEVMAIDAHHCPGAVMYLFRGEFGCMLYTGDFRWEATDGRVKAGQAMLLNALEGSAVDIMYMDNTYCNPSFSFPSREIVAQQVVDIIVSHPEHDIIIGIDSLGKEELLLHISCMLKIKIWVWPERLQTLHLLGFHDIFTTKTSLTRVRAVPRYSFSIETLEGLNAVRPTIGIIPSGLPWVMKPTKGNDKLFGSLSNSHDNIGQRCTSSGTHNDTNMPNGNLTPMQRLHRYIYSVPYSDHSCFTEIQVFVKLLRPTYVRGIVSSSYCNVDPSYHFGHFCGGKQPSQELHRKSGITGGREKVEVLRTKSSFAKESSLMVGKRRGIATKRVSLLRRMRRGVKMGENDS